MTKVIHIGLPKTATTSFQYSVFPKFCQEHGITYNPASLHKLLGEITSNLWLKNQSADYIEFVRNEIEKFDRLFISLESLVGLDPGEWVDCAELNKRIFGSDATIIITLRPPREFLTSLWLETLYTGTIVSERQFFLRKNIYNKHLPYRMRFSIDEFSYTQLLKIYNSHFQNIEVVPWDKIFDCKWLAVLTEERDLSTKEVKYWKDMIANFHYRRSFSRQAVKLTFRREKILQKFGLASRGTQIQEPILYLTEYEKLILDFQDSSLQNVSTDVGRFEHIPNEDNDYKMGLARLMVFRLRKVPLLKKANRIRIKIASSFSYVFNFFPTLIFHWGRFVTQYVHKLLPYSKYEIDFEALDIDIDELERDYLKSVIQMDEYLNP